MSNGNVVMELSFRIDASRQREFRQHADVVLRGARPSGCLDRALFVRVGEPGVFLWVERWASRQLLVPHLESSTHRSLVGAIRVLGQLEAEHVVSLGGEVES